MGSHFWETFIGNRETILGNPETIPGNQETFWETKKTILGNRETFFWGDRQLPFFGVLVISWSWKFHILAKTVR